MYIVTSCHNRYLIVKDCELINKKKTRDMNIYIQNGYNVDHSVISRLRTNGVFNIHRLSV